jgi:hypothetical protein
VEPRTTEIVTPPLPIDLALLGTTVMESAQLRERHVLPFVVDAMVLIEDALHRTAELRPTMRARDNKVTPWPKPSALSHLMALHAIRVYGKPDLLEEVAGRLPGVAAKNGRDPGPAYALIRDEYAPQMRLVDPSTITLPDVEELLAQVVAIDPDDEPTARLSRLLDPSILLTRDRKALLRFGFGQWLDDPEMDAVVSISKDDWLKATLRVRNRAFEAQMEVGGQLMVVSGRAAVAGGRKAIQVALDNPIPAALLLAAAVVVLWMARDSAFWPELGKSIARTTATAAEEIDKRTRGRPEAAAAAGLKLDAYLAKHTSPELPVALLARTLSIAPPAGLTVQELRQITGHRFAVRPIVEAHSAFVVDENGRWHLGHPARVPA